MRKSTINNPRYPHTIKIVRISPAEDADDPLAEEGGEAIETPLYEGKGRSFTDTTTTGGEEVDVNKRKASIPVRFDVWEAGKLPLDGDTLYATVGNNTEVGRVRDCEPDNDRTIVYWELVRV